MQRRAFLGVLAMLPASWRVWTLERTTRTVTPDFYYQVPSHCRITADRLPITHATMLLTDPIAHYQAQ